MEDELGRLVDQLPGLVWVAQPDGRVDFLNQAWCEYTGLPPSELLGRGWQAVIHPDDLPSVLAHWPPRAVASGLQAEARLRRSDGAYRWFALHSRPLSKTGEDISSWCGTLSDIDDIRRAQGRTQVQQVSFREMCDSIPGLVASLNPKGDVEHVNRPLLDFFGRTLEEIKNWATADIIHPDDLPQAIDAFTHAVATESPYDVEHRCRRFDGTYRWFHVRALPVRAASSEMLGWWVLLTDTEDRKQAEHAIRSSEQNLDLIINTIPTMAWSAFPDGSVEFLNRHYLDYVGLTLEQAIGKGWSTTIHPEDLPAHIATWERVRASATAGEAEARHRRHDGEYRWFLVRASPLFDKAGRIVKWYGTNTDIDDRKRAEERMRRSETFLAEGERLNSTGSFCWPADANEVSFSRQCLRIFGFDVGESVTLEKVTSRVHPEDRALVAEKVALARQGIDAQRYELRLRMPDGAIKHLRTNAFGTRGEAGRVEYIGAIQDITAQVLAEEALNNHRSELAHMTRVASLGVLTACIAHEVNQPLSGIITNASTCLRMLAAEPPNVEGARETVRRTIRDTNRASDVVTRLKALFSKKTTPNESVDMNEVAREVITLSASELLRGRVALSTDLARDLPPVMGDRIQLQQVILNLMLNACAAMATVNDRPKLLSVKTENDQGGQVRVVVRDAGVGLDPQAQERLFEPFFSTKSDGMGLGLSVSRSIVESHGGHLWATNNDGPGASFLFSIPARRSA